jgi:hypothetical protein
MGHLPLPPLLLLLQRDVLPGLLGIGHKPRQHLMTATGTPWICGAPCKGARRQIVCSCSEHIHRHSQVSLF